MALLLIEKTSGEFLVSMDWSSDYPTLKARVQQILATNTGGIILPLEQGHRLILLTSELDPALDTDARERMERLVPHANRLVDQPLEVKPKKSPFIKLEEITALEMWFKDLKMEDPELNRVVANPLDFKAIELMGAAMALVIVVILIRGIHVLIPHPLVAGILYVMKLPFLGLAVALCLVVPLWGGYFRQTGMMGAIQGVCYFCFCTLGSRAWLGTLPSDILGSVILGFVGYFTGMLGQITHEKIFVAVFVQIFSIILLLLTLLLVFGLEVNVTASF